MTKYTYEQVIDVDEIKRIIEITFSGDDKLFGKYHIINDDIEASLVDTVSKVTGMVSQYGALFYKIVLENEVIGYINIAPQLNLLHSFGIKKEARCIKSKDYLVKLIDKLFENSKGVCCPLYSKNDRAIRFLVANGFENQNIVTLIKK